VLLSGDRMGVNSGSGAHVEEDRPDELGRSGQPDCPQRSPLVPAAPAQLKLDEGGAGESPGSDEEEDVGGGAADLGRDRPERADREEGRTDHESQALELQGRGDFDAFQHDQTSIDGWRRSIVYCRLRRAAQDVTRRPVRTIPERTATAIQSRESGASATVSWRSP